FRRLEWSCTGPFPTDRSRCFILSFTSSKNSNTFDAICLLKDLMPEFKEMRQQVDFHKSSNAFMTFIFHVLNGGVCASVGHLHNMIFVFTSATGCLCLRWVFVQYDICIYVLNGVFVPLLGVCTICLYACCFKTPEDLCIKCRVLYNDL
ncbi:hypothetical protein Taro_021934, partial [Colocasia esculenta]|nr:hypothetical protein [Colocasia esculenta]